MCFSRASAHGFRDGRVWMDELFPMKFGADSSDSQEVGCWCKASILLGMSRLPCGADPSSTRLHGPSAAPEAERYASLIMFTCTDFVVFVIWSFVFELLLRVSMLYS